VTKSLWWKHIAAVQSINEVRFMKLKVARKFLKHAIPDFADKLLFVSFQQNKLIGLFSNTDMNRLCIPHFRLKRR